MNTVTENYWLIYAAATVWPYHVGVIFSHQVNLTLATPIPCTGDHDDIVPSKNLGQITFYNILPWVVIIKPMFISFLVIRPL